MVGDKIKKAGSNDADEGGDVLRCFNKCPTDLGCGKYKAAQRSVKLTILRRNEREYVGSRIEENGILRIISEVNRRAAARRMYCTHLIPISVTLYYVLRGSNTFRYVSSMHRNQRTRVDANLAIPLG